MSAMSDMSRAIRIVIEGNTHTGTLQGVPTETLRDFVEIVGAFYADMRDELKQRQPEEFSVRAELRGQA
jgi:hypothetical protein